MPEEYGILINMVEYDCAVSAIDLHRGTLCAKRLSGGARLARKRQQEYNKTTTLEKEEWRMPGLITTELGKITMTEELIANIAGMAAMENYGIVGMNATKASDTIIQLVGGDNHKRGVVVTLLDNGEALDIDLYVTLVYGVTLPTVAQNTIQNVRYRVSDMTGLQVRNVNIHVESIRV